MPFSDPFRYYLFTRLIVLLVFFNSVFDEDFVFEEHPAVIGRRTIEILLYDFDSYSRHFCIGGTQIDLGKLDLTHKIEMWQFLGSCSEQDAKVELGDIMVSMSYLPSAERLTVVLIKARNLKVVDMSRNASDPYVKLSLIQNGKKIKKKKSGVYRNTTCPVFNEALTFDIPKDTLKTCTIEVLVAHDSLLGTFAYHSHTFTTYLPLIVSLFTGSNEIIGRALVGNDRCFPQVNRAMFDDLLRSKSATATAQWLSLTDPAI